MTRLSSEQAVCKLVVMCAVIWKLDTVYREALAIQKLNCPIIENSRFIFILLARHVQCDKDDLPISGTPETCCERSAEKHLRMIFQFQVPPNLAVKGLQRSI